MHVQSLYQRQFLESQDLVLDPAVVLQEELGARSGAITVAGSKGSWRIVAKVSHIEQSVTSVLPHLELQLFRHKSVVPNPLRH